MALGNTASVFVVGGLAAHLVGAELLAFRGSIPVAMAAGHLAAGGGAPGKVAFRVTSSPGDGGHGWARRTPARGRPGAGMLVGSNIFNVLFILGVSALHRPLVVGRQLVRLDPCRSMIASPCCAPPLALDGEGGAPGRPPPLFRIVVYHGPADPAGAGRKCRWQRSRGRIHHPPDGNGGETLDLCRGAPGTGSSPGRNILFHRGWGWRYWCWGRRWSWSPAIKPRPLPWGVAKLVIGLYHRGRRNQASPRWPPPSWPPIREERDIGRGERVGEQTSSTSWPCWALGAS